MLDYRFRDVLTREQLAQFLLNPQTIRALENMAIDVGTVLPANEAQILATANQALALSAQAMMLAEQGHEEPTVIPGPAGPAGAGGGGGSIDEALALHALL